MAGKPTDDAGDDWATELEDQNGGTPVSFDELGVGSTDQEGAHNLDFLLDIPLEVTVELGRTKMMINNMLHLTQGSVIELSKTAGEPVEIYVNSKLLGKGEVIVVNERFGIRITEIISQADRIKNIG
nr:flagellar motor switch protein FliN [Desulfobulbaceae bacterium]